MDDSKAESRISEFEDSETENSESSTPETLSQDHENAVGEGQDRSSATPTDSLGSSLEALSALLVETLGQANPVDISTPPRPFDQNDPPGGSVVISGVGLGLPTAAKNLADPAGVLNIIARLTVSAGLDALKMAGIPLVQLTRARWELPEPLQEETGVIFASPYPGYDGLVQALERHYEYQSTFDQLKTLGQLRQSSDSETGVQIDEIIEELKEMVSERSGTLDPSLIFRALAQGHSQFSDYVGARGPGTHVNAAGASMTQALALAEDWIRLGRCRRVVIICTTVPDSERLVRWLDIDREPTGQGLDPSVGQSESGETQVLGACSLVIESEDALRDRGMRGIAELLWSEIRIAPSGPEPSAGNIVARSMENLIGGAEQRFALRREEMAPRLVILADGALFAPAGHSAGPSAVEAVFGDSAAEVIVTSAASLMDGATTTGYEDVIAIKILESGEVPPAPESWFESADLSHLYLSKGGRYTPLYILHLAADPGSQLAMILHRRIPGNIDRLDDRVLYQQWLEDISGYENAETRVSERILRLESPGSPIHRPVLSPWRYGLGPKVLAAVGDWTGGGDLAGPEMGEPTREGSAGEEPALERGDPEPVISTETIQPEPRISGDSAGTADKPGVLGPAIGIGEAVIPPGIEMDGIAIQTLMIAAEHTGVAIDMLDLDLDLRTGLAISEKEHAEILIDICQTLGVTGYVNLKMSDYPTIAHMIAFVRERRPDLAEEDSPPIEEESESTGSARYQDQEFGHDPLALDALHIVSEETGYPVDMLLLSLDLEFEEDLGIDNVEQIEVFRALCRKYELECPEGDLLVQYPTLAHVIAFLRAAIIDRADAGHLEPVSELEEDPFTATGEAILIATEDVVVAEIEEVIPEDRAPQNAVAGWTPLSSMELDGPGSEKTPPIVFAITETVILITAEQTGKPINELTPETDLLVDLGLGNEPHAEVVSAILESFGIPQPEELQPADYVALGDLIHFVRESRPDLVDASILEHELKDGPVAVESRPEAERIEPGPVLSEDSRDQEDAFATIRRVPMSTQMPPLDKCRSTGITFSGKRFLVMFDRGGVGEALVRVLRNLGATTLPLISTARGEELEERVLGWLADGPIDGVYWLAGLDIEPPLNQINLENWRELNRQRVKNLYHTMRVLYDSINLSSSFLISATRMGGLHGYGDPVVTAPMGGSITGFLKAFQREKGAALVKAIDFELDMESSRIAQAIVSETTRDPDPLEVGYHGENRYGVSLAESTLSRDIPGLTLDERTVYLVTGAANRLTNEIVVDLASNGGTFYLLDLVAVPDAADPRVALFRTDKKALREQLIEEIKTAVPEPTPSMVERIMTAIGREVEVLEAIESVGAAGGVAHYYCLDLLDEAAVSTIVDEIRQEHGRIDVILHTTGLEISRALPEKDPVQFNLVYDLNVDGFFNLLKATENMSVEALGVFSVMETRFGTWGQADSTAADDLLRKVIISLDRQRPETRGFFLSWMAGKDGVYPGKLIDELSLTAGSGFALVRDELTSGTAHGEIYVELGSQIEAGHGEVNDPL